MADLTRILAEAQEGREGAASELVSLLYEELRELARQEMVAERAGHTLQPTALVHEAYLRLVGAETRSFESRGHFFAAAATAIRRVLVDHARRRGRVKRGGGEVPAPLDDAVPAAPMPPAELLDLDQALARLAAFDPFKARLVELRFFAGMTLPELARVLGTSESSVQRDWRLARAWLREELGRNDGR